jgi:TolB protein
MQRILNALAVIIIAALAATTARAQVSVKKNFLKRPFAVTGFTGDPTVAGQLTEVLKGDVRLSGCLEVAPSEQAEFVQQGAIRGDHGGLMVDCYVTQQATKQTVLARSYPASAQDLRRIGHVISDDIVKAITGQRGIAETKIAFVWTHGRIKELATMDYDGYNSRQLTYDKSISVHPRWSPDGRKIVYTSYLSVFPDMVEADLYTHQRRRLASFPGLNTGGDFSPDGLKIALTLSKDGNPELYTMDAAGGGFLRLTYTRGAESSPTWSPDSQSIAYVSDDRGSPQIYVIGKDGGEPTRLTVSPSYNTEPDWSHPPAGSDMKPMLAVTSRVGGQFQIGLYDSTTREVKPVAADDADNEDPTWAPDGRHLVYAKTRHYRSRLYLLDVVTGEQVELPAVEGDASEPAWGP